MNEPQKRPRRQPEDLLKLPRSPLLSQLYRAAEALSPPNFPPVSKFSSSVWWGWASKYLKYVFRRRHACPAYAASATSAVYALPGDDGSAVRISMAGDWGTGTDEADDVGRQMLAFEPHFTIHLGDVYYVGDPEEINENCLNTPNPANNYTPVKWPHGSAGSFALNGNHEMYANGDGYFDLFLPTLGMAKAGGEISGQQTSFFCLQNQYWRIIAVDTGYNSIGLPLLSQIPLVNRIPFVGGDCKLPRENVEWLKKIVRPAEDKRGLVVLSHHQYYSAFEGKYPLAAKQMWKAGVQRPVLWFWGHEHRLAGYDIGGGGRLRAFGRCIGHGGMPIDAIEPKGKPEPLFYDLRKSKTNNFGINGSVNLTFAGANLTAEYLDLTGERILTENWRADSSGAVKLIRMKKETADPDFVVRGSAPGASGDC